MYTKRFLVILLLILQLAIGPVLGIAPWHPKAQKMCAAIKDGRNYDLEQMLIDGVPPDCQRRTIIENMAGYLVEWRDTTTPLQYACKWGNAEAVEILLRYGATVDVRTGLFDFYSLEVVYANPEGINARFEIIPLLLKYGAKTYCPSNPWKGSCSFVEIRYTSEDEVDASIELLGVMLEYGADTINEDGRTLITYLCFRGEDLPEMIEFLIGEGIDPNQKDNSGKTAYDYAVSEGLTESAELLLKYK